MSAPKSPALAQALVAVKALVVNANPSLTVKHLTAFGLNELLGFLPDNHPLALLSRVISNAENYGYEGGEEAYDLEPLARLALHLLAQQPAPAPADEVLQKAALWDALMGSAELHHVGSAGLTPDSRQWQSSYAHLGLALTTHRSVNETGPDPDPRGREMLLAFLKKRAALADAERTTRGGAQP